MPATLRALERIPLNGGSTSIAMSAGLQALAPRCFAADRCVVVRVRIADTILCALPPPCRKAGGMAIAMRAGI